jgi:predicted dehydrogenase
MKFTDTCFGNLIASKVFGADQETLKIYGKDKILTFSTSGFTISDGFGKVIEESEYNDDEITCTMKLLENFAQSVLLPDNSKLCSSANDNLNDMAVIEAAYLSARTGMPEEPGRIIKMAQIEPVNIRPAHI